MAGGRTLAFSWTQRGGSQSSSSGVWSLALPGHEIAALGSPVHITSGVWGFFVQLSELQTFQGHLWALKVQTFPEKKKIN